MYASFTGALEDLNTPATTKLVAAEIVKKTYLKVSDCVSLLSNYDLSRILLGIMNSYGDIPETYDTPKPGTIQYEVTTLAMLISAAEGAFHYFLDMTPLQVTMYMDIFFSLEHQRRKDPTMIYPMVSFETSTEELAKIYESYLKNEKKDV